MIREPVAAFNQLRQLAPDDPARPDAFRALHDSWRIADPKEAKRAFAELPLSETERASLVAPGAK